MLLAAAMGLALQISNQNWPLTRAEATQYAKTSSYADVVDFLNDLQRLGAPIRVQSIGKSTTGKDLPLVICHRNPNITPHEAKRSGKPIVYIQANIHAGEVEGKEAVLRLLRELAQSPKDTLLDKLVMVITPIYNIDGNDKWGTNKANRGHQDGPDPVGERANGQGFDLNRDCMKAESNEFRAVLDGVWNTWGPDVLFDLHTTNGTRHGYVLTYSPGLNPTSDKEVMKFTRDELLPKMRNQLRRSHKYELFDYGDASGPKDNMVFSTFACEPRYVTNYASIRNRVSILSEAASFQPFKLRVESTHAFVRACLDEIARQDRRIVEMVRNADRRTVEMGLQPNQQLGIRFAFDNRGKEKVLLEVERPSAEIDHMKAPTAYRTLEMTIVDRFKVTESTLFPWAYVVPEDQTKVTELLRRHGVSVEQILESAESEALAFTPTKFNIAGSAFQGHKLQSLEGSFMARTLKLLPNSYLIRTSQPLGLVAFHLLEPQSMDGVLAWGVLGEPYTAKGEFPIYKLPRPMNLVTRIVSD